MTYRKNQASEIAHLMPPSVEWLLLGGPADGNEANTLRLHFPRLKCIGFEPNEAGYRHQLPTFPGKLLKTALWDANVVLQEVLPSVEDTDADRGRRAVYTRDAIGKTSGRTLDSLSVEHGPFTNAVLWLDIEGSEERALRGAAGLLSSGAVLLVNLEEHCEGDTEESHTEGPLAPLMGSFGFKEVFRWNGQRYSTGCRYDIVYGRSGDA